MTDTVLPIRFNVEEVGKHVKSSKKRFTWQVSMNGRQHAIVLDFSFISGKVKVTVDRKILLENQLPANTSFQYPFTLDGNSLNVIQQGESFELRINNKVFSHLYNQAKTNKEFKKYEDEIKDFKVNQSQFQAKKLTLNIGGVGGGMKKKTKNQSAEGHNWNAFGEDEMSGFPNYFDGQSTSTASSAKVEENFPTSNVKKAGSLLDEDQSINITQKQDQKTQNILDFEAEMQKTQVQVQNVGQTRDQFSTMQMMFQTMNLNPFPQSKQEVVIDSSEVDFFGNSQESMMKPSQPEPKTQIDFFSDINNQPSQVTPQVTQQKMSDFNTMQYMFATNQGVGNNGIQSSFNTSSQQKSQQWNTQSNNQANSFGTNMGGMGMNTGINMNTLNNGSGMNTGIAINTGINNGMNSGINLNTGINFGGQIQSQAAQQQQINPNNFSTLQGLFATNSMSLSQASSTSNPTVVQQQNNFSLNTQHFATQGIPSQGFGTGLSANQFGTQNLMGHQQGFGQQINFLQQKPQQPLVSSQAPVQQSPEINANDFSSMQMLFKTNNLPQSGVTLGSQPSVQKPQVDSFSQQFATMGGSTTQSPNAMFMNTYGGSSNQANLTFDMGLGGLQGNASMMKKKTAETPVIQSGNAADLL